MQNEIPSFSKNFELLRWVWNNLVPKSGQSSSVQGELLRAVEKLAWEAQNNGNQNWDKGFELLADFIEQTLCSESKIGEAMSDSVRRDLATLRDYHHPYTGEDLYDRLRDAVAAYCRLNPRLLPHKKNPKLKR